jgi:hypothetical protein
MRHWVAAALLAACALPVAAQEKKKTRYAEIEIVELKAVRDADRVHIDGRVRNSGDAPGLEIQLTLFFLSSDGKTVSNRRGPLEAEEIGPGEEVEFRFDTLAPARAISLRVEATGRGERVLKVIRPGPYTLE